MVAAGVTHGESRLLPGRPVTARRASRLRRRTRLGGGRARRGASCATRDQGNAPEPPPPAERSPPSRRRANPSVSRHGVPPLCSSDAGFARKARGAGGSLSAQRGYHGGQSPPRRARAPAARTGAGFVPPRGYPRGLYWSNPESRARSTSTWSGLTPTRLPRVRLGHPRQLHERTAGRREDRRLDVVRIPLDPQALASGERELSDRHSARQTHGTRQPRSAAPAVPGPCARAHAANSDTE